MAVPSRRALAHARVYEHFNLLQCKRDWIGPKPDDAQASCIFAGRHRRNCDSRLFPPIPEAGWATLADPRKTDAMHTGGSPGLRTGHLRWTRMSAIKCQKGYMEGAQDSRKSKVKYGTGPWVPHARSAWTKMAFFSFITILYIIF